MKIKKILLKRLQDYFPPRFRPRCFPDAFLYSVLPGQLSIQSAEQTLLGAPG